MAALPVLAAIVTHRRYRLAGELVRRLVDEEGIPPSAIIVVVNGEGGLDDAELEAEVDLVRLPVNLGPAGGFHAALARAAHRLGDARWVYVCEDDVALFDLPFGRLASLVELLETEPRNAAPVGAVMAYGRDLHRRTGVTRLHAPSSSRRFDPIDVGPWGATLVSRAVLDAGVLPKPEWFFGYEDHDFWLRVAGAGFALLVDNDATLAVTGRSRAEAFVGQRPADTDEPWRAYYVARNFLELARRHGHPGWTMWHLVKSARRMQVARSAPVRRAIVSGLKDGFRGRLGFNAEYQREVGEL